PIGFVTALVALRMVPASSRFTNSLRGLDLPGALCLVSGLALLVYAIRESSTRGWGSTDTLPLLAAAAALLGLFAVVERRARRPRVTTTIWRVRSLVSSATVMLGVTGILVATFFLGSLFLQRVLNATPLETGLDFLPLVVVTGVAAHLGGRLLARFGARAVVVGGLSLIAAGNVLLSGADTHAAYLTDLLPGFVLLGF